MSQKLDRNKHVVGRADEVMLVHVVTMILKETGHAGGDEAGVGTVLGRHTKIVIVPLCWLGADGVDRGLAW